MGLNGIIILFLRRGKQIVERDLGLDIVPIAIVLQPISGDERDMNRPFLADNLAKCLNAPDIPSAFLI